MASADCEVAIVGGGIAGLAAAWTLRDRDILLLEAEDRVGGKMKSERRGDHWINLGAHIVSGSSAPVGWLADQAGVERRPIVGDHSAIHMNGRLLRGGRPELLPFRFALPMAGRLSLIRTGLRLKAAHRITRRYGTDVIHGLAHDAQGRRPVAGDAGLDSQGFEEVLGPMHADVAGLLRSASNRFGLEPAQLNGHFGANLVGALWGGGGRHCFSVVGGSEQIPRAIARRLGNRIRTGCPAQRVVRRDGSVVVETAQGPVRARQAILATPAFATRDLVDGLPDETAAALSRVVYGSYVVMAAFTRETEAMAYDDVYGTCVAGRTLSMIFNSANCLRADPARRARGGALMMYAGGQRARDLLERSDEEIAGTFLDDLYAVYPETIGKIGETRIQRWPRAYAAWGPGRLALQAALEAPLGDIHLAGDYLDYPSTDTAAASGIFAARAARAALGEG